MTETPAVPSDVDYVWVTPDHEVVLRELRGYVTLGMSNDGFWAGERTTAELPADAVRMVPAGAEGDTPTAPAAGDAWHEALRRLDALAGVYTGYARIEEIRSWVERGGDGAAEAVDALTGGLVPDTGQEAGADARESLYVALRRFAYAWETDTPDKEMWAEWQRAKDAMTAYRSTAAVTDTGAGDLAESVLRICSELNIDPEDDGWADEIIRRAQRSAYSQGWHDATEQARKAMARRAVPDTGPPPLDFDVLVRSIVDSRYMWISMENAVDMAVTTARLLVDAGAVRIVADGQPVELHGSLGAMRRLVHSRGITADERDHDVAVSRPVPPLEGRERDRLREVLDAAGLPRDRDWDDVLLALRSMGARAVPDTGQAREPDEQCQDLCKHCGAAKDQWVHAGCPIVEVTAEPSAATVQAPGVARRLAIAQVVAEHWRDVAMQWGDDQIPGHAAAHPLACVLAAIAGETDELGVGPGPDADRIRVLLGTDTTPDRLAWISEAGETAAAERQARYQETACARRPVEERPDA